MVAALDWFEGEARVVWILVGRDEEAIAAAFGTGVNAVRMQKRRVLQALADGRPSKHMERFAELGLLPLPLVRTRNGDLYEAPKG